MDPLSITVSVTSLLFAAGRIIQSVNEIHSQFKHAPLLISSISTECTVVYASLGLLQDLLENPQSHLASATVNVRNAIHMATLGCALTLSVLEKDLQSCVVAGKDPHDIEAVRRSKVVMGKDHLQELVVQLRGQQTALGLLFNLMQR